MAANIKDLFTYKKEVTLENREGKKATIWVRLLGESDLNESFKLSRIASTRRREALRDVESLEYQDEIVPLGELTREELTTMILGTVRNRFMTEAFVKVDRDEIPKIEEFAVEPDAPTLEEQENLDKKIEEQRVEYDRKIDDYINARLRDYEAELKAKKDDEIVKEAQSSMADILPLQAFFAELNAQKGWRGAYIDEKCKQRIFTDVNDFKEADDQLKKQISDAYSSLELGSDDIKN